MNKKWKLLIFTLFISFYAFSANAENDLTDGQIAQIVLNANTIDILNGEVAKERASHPEVKTFAQRMINDHNNSNKEVQDLLKKINLSLGDSKISQELKADAEKALKKLKDSDKDDFDEDYIKAEIKLHEKVIDVAESKLVPKVQNQELKALLEKTHPILVSHREHAKKVLDSVD